MSSISGIFDYQSPFGDYDGFTNRSPDDGLSLTDRGWKITNVDLLKYIQSGEVSRESFYTWIDRTSENKTYTKDDTFKYFTYVYTSTDAIKLHKIYKSLSPREDEMLVFIEDNSSDTSSQKHYIKIGKGLKKELKSNINYVKYSKESFSKFGITVDDDDYKQINKLIEDSVAEFTEFDALWLVLKLTTSFSINIAIDGLDSVISGIRGLKIESKYWNPDSEDLKNEKYFEPYFFPVVKFDRKNERFIFSAFNQEIDLNKNVDELFNSIDSQIAKAKKRLSTEESGYLVYIDPLKLRYLPITINEYILKALREILKFVNDFVAEGLLFFNAIFCGFINSIVEIIAGFFELINLLFKGVNALLFSTNWDEYYDNFIQAIAKVDFKKVFTEFLALAGEIFPKVIKSIANSVLNISKEQVGYFVGYVIGLVLEFVLTEGVGTVKSLISKGTKAVGKFFDIIFEFIESIIKKGGSKKVDKLQALSEFFSRGTDDVVDSVRQLRKRLNKYLDDGALKHLDQDDYDSFTSQKQFIEDVESGKQSINPGTRSSGANRNVGDPTLKGNYGECKMNQEILEKSSRRYKPLVKLDSDPYKKFPTGIDGVFENLDFIPPPPPAKYIICEAKYSKKGNVGLSKTKKTADGLQMSQRWIKQRLRDSVPDKIRRDILKTYRDANNNKIRNYNSVLFKIDETGKVKYVELSVEQVPKALKNNFEI